jgi:hypothetical protein
MGFIPPDGYYPLCALLFWGLASVLIPKGKWKPLFWYGLVWGFLAGYIFIWIFGFGFHLFEYKLGEPFKSFGVCVWLTFAWIPAIMIYLYELPSSRVWYVYPMYLIVFALASASLDQVFHAAGLLKYDHWNPFFRFIIALLWFWWAKLHYTKMKAQN